MEMTESEKVDFVNALYQLRTGPDIINDLSIFHRNFFNLDEVGDGTQLDLHFNLPDEPERDVFLAWHRRQMIELELAIQELYPYLSIPYIDWSRENSVNSEVWDFNFMGQFNEDWNLNRDLGGAGRLPEESDVEEVLNISSDYLVFSNSLERGVVHAGPHNWVGGVMTGGFSPRDPIFYLHHAFVDKIWATWQAENNSSLFQRNSMLRYDGTYLFDGKLLPSVNPNDLVNSNSLGIFYAENKLAKLENYEVSNFFLENEYFYYQFQIEIDSNFRIPNGKKSTVASLNQIVIKPGFHAESGSNFSAFINNETLNKSKTENGAIVRNQIPFKRFDDEFVNLYNLEIEDENFNTDPIVFPNPFNNALIISKLVSEKTYHIRLFDILGNLIYFDSYNTHHSNSLELKQLKYLTSGIYILHIQQENFIPKKIKIFKL